MRRFFGSSLPRFVSIVRCKTTLEVNGIKEEIITRSDMPKKEYKKVLKGETLAVLGYGPQGRGQALNLRDNGVPVVVGVRKGGDSWKEAVKDNWKPGKNLVSIEEAASKGTIVQYLLSDAAQIDLWPTVKPFLTKGKALYFSHGFGIVFTKDTNIVPPADVDVILVAPKGSGRSVRDLFVEGKGINASFAIHQDSTGRANERAIASAFAIGAGHLFRTTFEKEVTSDLTGERCVLMGMLQGAFLAQYEVLRANGHSPSEAYNETIEEALCSLYPLVQARGMDWMYANCSTTAQRGALDWAPKFHAAIKPVVEDCYKSVITGAEAKRSIECNGKADYRAGLNKELEAIANQEMWKVGAVLRKLRPGYKTEKTKSKK